MIKFTHCPMWVQVWGLPFELFSEDIARDIGRGIGPVVEVDCKGAASNHFHHWTRLEVYTIAT